MSVGGMKIRPVAFISAAQRARVDLNDSLRVMT